MHIQQPKFGIRSITCSERLAQWGSSPVSRAKTSLIAVAAFMVITACTSAPNDSSSDGLPDNQFVAIDRQQFIDQALASRESHPPGTSDLQLETLIAALDAGEMSYETYSKATDNQIQCLEDAGYGIIDLGTERRFGTLFRNFRMVPPPGITEQQENNLSTACNTEHSASVEIYYISQASSQQNYLDDINSQRDSILKCLKGLGYETDPEAIAKELLYRITEASTLEDTTCYTGTYFAGYLDPEREEEIMAEYNARQGNG